MKMTNFNNTELVELNSVEMNEIDGGGLWAWIKYQASEFIDGFNNPVK